ncbi:hypothetical protein F5Y01DRAFT_122288 [Xylaria sp. FL0043]|nr:hypothetical protein F5Y01DRAFT_122288 [Xylaria sp. FL0043]
MLCHSLGALRVLLLIIDSTCLSCEFPNTALTRPKPVCLCCSHFRCRENGIPGSIRPQCHPLRRRWSQPIVSFHLSDCVMRDGGEMLAPWQNRLLRFGTNNHIIFGSHTCVWQGITSGTIFFGSYRGGSQFILHGRLDKYGSTQSRGNIVGTCASLAAQDNINKTGCRHSQPFLIAYLDPEAGLLEMRMTIRCF